MWSGPRNLSTAMMRAFGNRPDCTVIDEPFYAAYSHETGADHPLRQQVLQTQPLDWRQVETTLLGPVPDGRPIFYQKHMTHHMLPAFGRNWIEWCCSAFLIRAPERVLRSYAARREEVTLDDIGFRQQAEIFDAVCERLGHAAPVIDAEDVRANPARVLNALCAALGIPFLPSMLHWPAGPRLTDGAWAPAWYGSVEASRSFTPPSNEDGSCLPPALRGLAEEAARYYHQLAAFRL
jgi:hypothetical protein